jgi:hypothetical protein
MLAKSITRHPVKPMPIGSVLPQEMSVPGPSTFLLSCEGAQMCRRPTKCVICRKCRCDPLANRGARPKPPARNYLSDLLVGLPRQKRRLADAT